MHSIVGLEFVDTRTIELALHDIVVDFVTDLGWEVHEEMELDQRWLLRDFKNGRGSLALHDGGPAGQNNLACHCEA